MDTLLLHQENGEEALVTVVSSPHTVTCQHLPYLWTLDVLKERQR